MNLYIPAAQVHIAKSTFLIDFKLSFRIIAGGDLQLHGQSAVSYTHLDVYKRQVQDWSGLKNYTFRLLYEGKNIIDDGAGTVRPESEEMCIRDRYVSDGEGLCPDRDPRK